MERKRRLLKTLVCVFAVLFLAVCAVSVYVVDSSNPKNIIARGNEYSFKLLGISEFDESGFTLVSQGLYSPSGKAQVVVGEDGLAKISSEEKGEDYVFGKFVSRDISYRDYDFCGESYKDRESFEEFLNSPDRIYGFDIDNLSQYIIDAYTYEKKFSGTAKVSVYRGRCVITEIYIGEEKVFEIK